MSFIRRRCTVIYETDKAFIVKLKSINNVCIPKSVCLISSKEPNRMTGYEQQVIDIKEWFYNKEIKPKLWKIN